MRLKKRCRYCPDLFTPDPRSYRPRADGKGRRSTQVACPKSECRRQCHCAANRRWRMNNPTYDDGREAQHRQWRKDHPSYSKDYRAAHPDYEKSNREKQRGRDRKRKNLANQDSIRTPPTRVSEEIRRYLKWSYHLANQDAIALQEKIAQNRGHEKPTP